jgi:hypothetical protein
MKPLGEIEFVNGRAAISKFGEGTGAVGCR